MEGKKKKILLVCGVKLETSKAERGENRNRRSHLFMVTKVNGSINCVSTRKVVGATGVRSSSLLMGYI